MAVIKTTRKDMIDQLQARLSLQLGKRFSQQEVVDLCIEFAQNNAEQLFQLASAGPRLTPTLAEDIIAYIEQLPKVPYDLTLADANDIDRDIYSL